MLTDEERAEIEQAILDCGTKESAGLDALRVVQRRDGWVSDERLRAVAEALDLSPAELDSVATFFNLIFRRPVGRHLILICDSVSCHIMGYEAIAEHLHSRLGIGPGETTADGRFTLLPSACLGACDRAPAMMIGEDLHGELTPARIDEILAAYP